MSKQAGHPFWTLASVGLGVAIAYRMERQRQLEAQRDFFVGKTALLDLTHNASMQAAAFALAARGASLILLSTNKRTLKALKKDVLKQYSDRPVFSVLLENTTAADYQNAVETALKQVGCIDILLTIIDNADNSHLDQLEASIELTRFAMRNMVERKHGVLAFISRSASNNRLIEEQLTIFCTGLQVEVAPAGLQTVLVTMGASSVDSVIEAEIEESGLRIPEQPIDYLLQRTLDAIVLGEHEVNVGMGSQLEQAVQQRYPSLSDWLKRLLSNAMR